MVTPYPPARDGIGAYAVQEVKRLRGEGHDVTVLSPFPSAAHQHLDLRTPRGVLALAKRVRAHDRLIVQYHPDVFQPPIVRPARRLATNLALCLLFVLARDSEARIHEVDYTLGRRPGPNGIVARLLWRLPDRLSAHTEVERREISKAFGLRPKRIAVADHGQHFERRTRLDRAGARRRLGVDPDATVFLSIGFVQPHKGFDRAIRAFTGLGEQGCELHVVGSVRVEEPAFLDHADELDHLCRRTPGAHLHLGYLSDERFDEWIVASDVIVLPYRQIWSSGVIERAALYDRPVIASRVGGLEGQAPEGTRLVDDDVQLRIAMAQAARAATGTAGVVAEVEWPAAGERSVVQAAVASAADSERGGPALEPIRPFATPARRDRDPIESLRRLPAIGPPEPSSARPGAALMKRVVRRLTAWEVDPVVHQVNRLRQATLDAVEGVAQAQEDNGPDPGAQRGQTDTAGGDSPGTL